MTLVRARPVALAAMVHLVALLTPGVGSAYRPFDGTDADVLQPGEFELELGPLHYAQEGNKRFFLTPTVLNLGVAARLEVVADFVPLYPRRDPVRVSDTDLFAKYLFRGGALQGEGGPSIALEAGPLLPEVNGRSGFGASVNLIASERWSWLTLHLNNEGQLSRKDIVFEYVADLIGEFDVGSRLRPVAELGFQIEPNSGAKGYSSLAGVVWNVADELALDAAGRVGRSDGENTFEARLGLTWTTSLWQGAGSEPGRLPGVSRAPLRMTGF